jgi:hypothetical protein
MRGMLCKRMDEQHHQKCACYCLSMWLNCLQQVAGVTVVQSGSVTHMMPVSSMTCASVRAPVAFPQLNLYISIGVVFPCQF